MRGESNERNPQSSEARRLTYFRAYQFRMRLYTYTSNWENENEEPTFLGLPVINRKEEEKRGKDWTAYLSLNPSAKDFVRGLINE
jgi:hypothetical protein